MNYKLIEDDNKLNECYNQICQEGFVKDVAKGVGHAGLGVAKGVGQVGLGVAKAGVKTAGKVGLAGAGLAAKGAGWTLEKLIKALDFLTADQLENLGNLALKKAKNIKVL